MIVSQRSDRLRLTGGSGYVKLSLLKSLDPIVQGTVPLVRVDQALTSLRSSGHDHCSAVGELIDNSLEAGANKISIRLFTEERTVGKSRKPVEVVDRIAAGDDGEGMTKDVLHHALSLGWSTRFNSRKSLGRFGVGAKLAAISQVKRVDLYSKRKSEEAWLWTYVDLDEVTNGQMNFLPEPRERDLPEDCADLMGGRGTLVIWSKADKLQQRDSGGARTADSVKSDLVAYVARTFRKFLDGGIEIYVDGKLVKPHDLLFLMTTTRFQEGPDPDPVAEILVNESFEWDVPTEPGKKSVVEVTLTLLPEKLRPHRFSGGEKPAIDRRIDDNEGISILRADREIFFGRLRGVQPADDPLDRWIGKEIRFSPELDECFAVRNVKKGAEPINGLRDKLRGDIIYKTIMTARRRVSRYWTEQQAQESLAKGVHAEAERIAAKAAIVSPKPVAGQKVSQEQQKIKLREAAKTLIPEPEKASEAAIQKKEEEIKSLPLKIILKEFPGNELFEIDHLGSTALVYLNMRHPFYREVYVKLLEATERGGNGANEPKERPLAKVAQVGFDLLLLAYARAEGMDLNPEDKYSELRTYWGVNLKTMVNEWVKS